MKMDVHFREVVQTLASSIPTSKHAAVLVRGLASAARTQWVQLAQQKLNTTARDYIQGISVPLETSPGVMEITLTGRVPNMVEQGWDGPIDLRQTVIPNARRKHRSKEGYEYVHVPFRHGTPGTRAANVGHTMPKPIHQVARHLSPMLSQPGQGSMRGPGSAPHRLHANATQVGPRRVSQEAQRLLQTKAQPWHSTSLYAGMVRLQKTYEQATQSSYRTWRTITQNPEAHTDERKWQHPGIRPKHLVREVQNRLRQKIEQILPMIR